MCLKKCRGENKTKIKFLEKMNYDENNVIVSLNDNEIDKIVT